MVLPFGGALLLGMILLVPRGQAQIVHLRVTRAVYSLAMPLLVVLALVAVDTVLSLGTMPLQDWLLLAAASGTASAVAEWLGSRATSDPRTRVAFVGSAAEAARLADDLHRWNVRRFELVGRIAVECQASGAPPAIGALGSLRTALVDARIDLLVLGRCVPRLSIFEELADTCLDLRTRMTEVPEFYERAFGYVAVSEINAAWFAQLMTAHARRPVPWVKRGLDLLLVCAVGVVALPLIAVLAGLVRLDGRPAVFAQTRIGEHGRPFRLYKLRTMHPAEDDRARWTADDDPRVTRLGAILRRLHLDELPQLWNIARGDMSFVGPRPEQPAFVAHLERVLPFYQRRHLIRPGLSGWAQVRCGYAGSEAGSAWKLCNDLYYYKHRSLAVDLLVLGETAGQILVGRFAKASTAPSVVSTLVAPLTQDLRPALAELAPQVRDAAAPEHQPVGA